MLGTDASRLRLSKTRPSPTRFGPCVGEMEDSIMKHSHMLWFCGALMVLAMVLAVAGAGAFAFLAPLGCVAMMAMMVWMMVRH